MWSNQGNKNGTKKIEGKMIEQNKLKLTEIDWNKGKTIKKTWVASQEALL